MMSMVRRFRQVPEERIKRLVSFQIEPPYPETIAGISFSREELMCRRAAEEMARKTHGVQESPDQEGRRSGGIWKFEIEVIVPDETPR